MDINPLVAWSLGEYDSLLRFMLWMYDFLWVADLYILLDLSLFFFLLNLSCG